jgi:hypothetical protein
MLRTVGFVLGLGVLAAAFVAAVDIVRTPTATRGQCLLTRRTLLPDICVNSCPTAFDCTVTTRPYLFFFTQAASCADGVIC